MEKPRVLVGVPIFDGMNYCLKEFLEGIRALTYSNCDVLLMDNSKSNEFFEELKKEKEIIVLKEGTQEEKPVLRLISSRNKIIEYALKNDYDYILMMDSDVIPPKNIIEELISCNKNIISGLYFNYFVSSGETKFLPVSWRAITPEEFELIKQKVRFPPHITCENLQRHMTQEEADSGKVLEVLYASAGCMLISKKIFENIKYDLIGAPEGAVVTDDIIFMKKVRKKGFKIYCNTKLKCEHLIKGKFRKDKDGNLIHPINQNYSDID